MSKRIMRDFVPIEKSLEDIFEEFQLENKIKNLSKMTIRYYEQNSTHFFQYLKMVGIESIEEVDKKVVDRYILFLKEEKGVSPATINIYLRAARAYLYFAMREDYLPYFKVKLIKVDIIQKEPFSDDEIRKLIEKPDVKNCGFVTHRNWVAVCYLLETGNRLNTVINIKVGDVSLKDGIVKLNVNKNRKTQYNPISEFLSEMLNEYIKMYKLEGDEFLFFNEFRKQMSRNGFYQSIVNYSKQRGVERTGLHIFRHSFAKNYLISDGNISKLQRLMGHSNINITMGYVNLYANDLKEGFEDHSIMMKFAKNKRMERVSNKKLLEVGK